jgi:hypothetical protein
MARFVMSGIVKAGGKNVRILVKDNADKFWTVLVEKDKVMAKGSEVEIDLKQCVEATETQIRVVEGRNPVEPVYKD